MSRVSVSAVLALRQACVTRDKISVGFALSRRSYSMATEKAPEASLRQAAAAAAAVAEPRGLLGKEEVFWMRDPKTGYWLPESRFDEVDAAELRARLLPNNRKI